MMRHHGAARWTLWLLMVVLVAGIGFMGWLLLRSVRPVGGADRTHTRVPDQVSLPAGPPASAIEALAKSQPLLVDGRWDEAVALLAPAAEAFPNDQELWLSLSSAHQGALRWAQALESLEVAIKLGPATADMHVQAGTIANRAGNLDAAAGHYTKAQGLEPRVARHPLFLAMIQLKQGRDDAAMASLARATVLDGSMAEAWGTMAEIELRRNNSTMALQHVEKARASQPGAVRWRVIEARAHRRAGEPAKAVALLENLPPHERLAAPALGELADALGMLRRPGDAASLYLDAAIAAGTSSTLQGEHLLNAARWQQRAGNIAKARQIAAEAAAAGNAEAVGFIADLK